MKHHHEGHNAMDPATNLLDRRGRLAVNEIKGALGMQPNELGVRLAQPHGVVLMRGSVDEEVPHSVYPLLPYAVGVSRGDHLHLVAGAY
jgi:hypothetical protein